VRLLISGSLKNVGGFDSNLTLFHGVMQHEKDDVSVDKSLIIHIALCRASGFPH